MARSKGRNVTAWTVAGLCFGALAFVAVLLLPKIVSTPNTQVSPRPTLSPPPPPPRPSIPPVAHQINNFIRPTAVTDRLRDLAQLRDDGIITDAEFRVQKDELLKRL